MTESLRDRVARVLGEHRTFGKVNVQDEPMTHRWFCSCGWATEPALYAEPEVPLSVFLKFQHEADALIAAGLVAECGELPSTAFEVMATGHGLPVMLYHGAHDHPLRVRSWTHDGDRFLVEYVEVTS